MKPLLSACLAVAISTLSATTASAELRIFVSPDGRTMEAELISATTDMATLKAPNGRTFNAPLTAFSDVDQKYIADWRAKNPVAVKYDFATSFTKDKVKSTKQRQPAKTVTNDTWVCKIKVRNQSGQTLEQVKVDYDIYYEEIVGNSSVPRKKSGSTTIASIKHLEELTVPTDEVTLSMSVLDGGYYYGDGARSRQRDSLAGLGLRLSHNGKEVFAWASRGVPAGRTIASGEKESLFNK